MNDEELLRSKLDAMVDKTHRSLSIAKDHLSAGHHDFASSRAYYAVFYMLQAILLTRNLAFSKHSGTISNFNQQFVKTGIFPKEFSQNIEKLFKDRQRGDYTFELRTSREAVKTDIEIAETIIGAIEEYLKKSSIHRSMDRGV